MRLVSLLLLAFCSHGLAQTAPFNDLILQQVAEMPKGGSYAVNRIAMIRLQSAANFESGKFFLLPSAASPSYCSGATYLVFLKVIEHLRGEGRLELDSAALSQLVIREQRDGEGVWGRWNANGPGTARLFHELKLGRNFSSFDQARPGDFMKIFWTKEVGKLERGHSVIYLGRETRPEGEFVRFWSSNQPAGYGEKAVPASDVVQVVFSRLETPANLAGVQSLPAMDRFLGSLLTKRSSFAEVRAQCGL